MSLQFIIGSSGAGKSYFAYESDPGVHGTSGEKLLYYCPGAVHHADSERSGDHASE